MAKVVGLEDRSRQHNFQTTGPQRRLLEYYCRVTESRATAGPTKGEFAIGALIRRISEGDIKLYVNGRVIQIPPDHLFDIGK